MQLKTVSLFSSAGIGELRLPDFVDVIVANELLKPRATCYKHFNPNTNMICGDITDNSVKEQIINIANER